MSGRHEQFVQIVSSRHTTSTKLVVPAPEDDAPQASVSQSAGAHDAGLDGYIERAFSHGGRRIALGEHALDRLDLCVPRAVAGGDGVVVPAADDAMGRVVEHAANRNLTRRESTLRLPQRVDHQAGVLL